MAHSEGVLQPKLHIPISSRTCDYPKQRRTQCCSGQAEIRCVGQPEELAAQLHNVVTTFDFNQEQTPVTRAAIEGFLEKVGAQLWIQHDYIGNARLKKAPDYYE